MSCGVSMERYDRGEQENLVLGSKKFLAHPKSPKTPKIKNFQKTPKKMHIITKPKSARWLLAYHDSFISILQIYAQK